MGLEGEWRWRQPLQQYSVPPLVGSVSRKLIAAGCLLARVMEQMLSYPVESLANALAPIGYSCGHFSATVPLGTKAP